jgi:hypothetical protein
VVDSLPHFGDDVLLPFKSRPWLALATVDNLVALAVFGGVLVVSPGSWLPTVTGVFFADLPDLLFLPDIFLKRPVKNRFTRLHSRVQNHSIGGAVMEVAWATIMGYMLYRGW